MYRFLIISSLLILFSLVFSCSENKAQNEEQNENIEKDRKKPVQAIPVEVAIVKQEAVQQNIQLTGVLQPIQSVDIISETSGKVEKVNINLGDWVTTNDILAKVDDRVPLSQYNQAKAEVLSAKSNLGIAQLNLTSDKELFGGGNVSKLKYENSILAVKIAEADHLSAVARLSLADKAYKDTRITSPINGIVSRKYIEKGTLVSNAMELFRVVNINTLKIEVGVPQKLINMISTKSVAQISISAMNNLTVPGKVYFISPQADGKTGTFLVEIQAANKNRAIKAGMTASIDLAVSQFDEQITIPNHALINKNDEQLVYKIENNKARLTEVGVNQVIGSNATINSGISKGDSIVVVGMKNLGVNTPVLIETVHE